MRNEYGRLSDQHFKAFIGFLPELRKTAKELADLLRDATPEQHAKLYETTPVWNERYELSFLENVVSCVNGVGLGPRMQMALQSSDPYASLHADLKSNFVDVPELTISFRELLQHIMPVWHSLRSIGLYGCSMSGLVALARDHGDSDALFKAVSVDQTAMHCPTIASAISNAQLRGDSEFAEKLANSLRGPSKKIMASLQDMRFSFFVLRELGIDNLADKDLEALMVGVLGVYSDSPTSAKNLSEAYRKSKNQKTI